MIRFSFWENLAICTLPRIALILGFILLLMASSESLGSTAPGLLILIPLVPVSRWLTIYRVANSPLNRYLWLVRHIEFDTAEMRSRNETGVQHIVPWSGIVKVKVVKDRYLLWMSTSMVFMIPKSSFKVPADEVAFREILARHRLI